MNKEKKIFMDYFKIFFEDFDKNTNFFYNTKDKKSINNFKNLLKNLKNDKYISAKEEFEILQTEKYDCHRKILKY